MSLVDRTNEEIPLDLELPEGYTLKLDVDRDSCIHEDPFVWLEVSNDLTDDIESKAWRMTMAEAAVAHDRLSLILGRPLTRAASQSDVDTLVGIYQQEWELYQKVWASLPKETAREQLDSQFRFRLARRILLEGYRNVGAA